MHIQSTFRIKEAVIAVALAVALAFMSFGTAFAQTYTTDADTTSTSGMTDTSSTSTPGVPNTGVGGDAAMTYALLALTGALAIGGAVYLSRMRNA